MHLGIGKSSYSDDQVEWLADEHGTESRITAHIDLADFAQATHAPNGYFPGGLHVSWEDEDTGQVKPDSNTAAEFAGFIFRNTEWPRDLDTGAYLAAGTISVPLMQHGNIVEPYLAIAPTANTRTGAIAAGVKYRKY